MISTDHPIIPLIIFWALMGLGGIIEKIVTSSRR